MLIRILKGLTLLVLILVAVYGLMLYLTRIDFEPAPVAGPSSPLRIGEWIMDIPRPLEVQHYSVDFRIGGQLLFLIENLEAPEAVSEEGLAGFMAKLTGQEGADAGWVRIADLSRDLGRAASMELKLQPLKANGRAPRQLLVRATIPQPAGYLSISHWLQLPDGLYGNWEQLDGFIREAQPSFVDQVKTILSRYRWIGPEISETPKGFMTRYGLLELAPGSFQVSTTAELSYVGESSTTFSYFINAWQQFEPQVHSSPGPPFWQKIEMLFNSLGPLPTRYQTKFRRIGGRPGYETVIFSYSREFDDLTLMLMEWNPEPETNGSGTVVMSHQFFSDGFKKDRAPEFYSLWRQVLDSAR